MYTYFIFDGKIIHTYIMNSSYLSVLQLGNHIAQDVYALQVAQTISASAKTNTTIKESQVLPKINMVRNNDFDKQNL